MQLFLKLYKVQVKLYNVYSIYVQIIILDTSENLIFWSGELYIITFECFSKIRFSFVLRNFVFSYESYTITFNFKLYNWRNVHYWTLHKQWNANDSSSVSLWKYPRPTLKKTLLYKSFLLCTIYELCAEYKLLVAAENTSLILNESLFERDERLSQENIFLGSNIDLPTCYKP